jgi:hypothetical protein
LGILKGSSPEIGSSEIGMIKQSAIAIGFRKIGSGQVCKEKFGSGQIGFPEIHSAEAGMMQWRFKKIGLIHVGRSHIPLVESDILNARFFLR